VAPGSDSPPEQDNDVLDAGTTLTDALARCYTHLARREHSVTEMRVRLERAQFDDATIDEALAMVVEQGYLDDARYARLLAEDRRAIDGWGVDRIRARLESAGVERDLIDATLVGFDASSERQAAAGLLARRFREPLRDDRDRQRAFAALIRQGYDSDIAYDAIRAHEASQREAAR
jgi:regulatory protein